LLTIWHAFFRILSGSHIIVKLYGSEQKLCGTSKANFSQTAAFTARFKPQLTAEFELRKFDVVSLVVSKAKTQGSGSSRKRRVTFEVGFILFHSSLFSSILYSAVIRP
jgi:hypothetical protein